MDNAFNLPDYGMNKKICLICDGSGWIELDPQDGETPAPTVKCECQLRKVEVEE